MAAFGTELAVRAWRRDHLLLQVTVWDGDHPGITCTFDLIEDGSDFALASLKIATQKGAELDGVFSPSLVRELPLTHWLRIARARATQWLRGPTIKPDQLAPKSPKTDTPEDQRRAAEAVIRYMHPDLDPNSGKGAARKWESLVRYATVLNEVATEVENGADDPAERLAERYGVAPATVRSWVFRGREAGIEDARRKINLDMRHPLWAEQLRSLRRMQPDTPEIDAHGRISLSMQLLHARELMIDGAAREKQREISTLIPGSRSWYELREEIRALITQAKEKSEEINKSAQQLSELRRKIAQSGQPLPLITRWVGSMIGETNEAAFYQYGRISTGGT